MNTLYVNYTSKGRPVADCETEYEILKEASLCVNGQDKEFQVSTENVINAVRAMKLNGKITCDLVLMFEGKELKMNEYGVIERWPQGFCDYNEKWVAEILSTRINIHKKSEEYRKSIERVAVICVDTDDFLNYRKSNGHDDGSIGTTTKYKYGNTYYHKIVRMHDLCSLALDDIVETVAAFRNPNYKEILNVAQSNLKSK